MNAQKKKNSRERRVLTGALVIAGVMIAGSTFAWFTSKDEVTNRLSASAEYSVAVGETFQPPENWVPGQTIGKDAAAVNTGNVDAFVRMYLDGSMRILSQHNGAGTTVTPIANYDTSGFTAPTVAVTDSNLLNLGLSMMDTAGNYYKTLETSQTINPGASVSSNNSGYAESFNGPYSEVQAMQGGILAYAPTNAEYSYVLNEETELKIKLKSTVDGAETTTYKSVQVPKGTLVHVGGTAGTAAELDTDGTLKITATETVTSTAGSTNDTAFPVVYVEAQSHDDSTTHFTPVNVEYESFTPMTDGLYLFLRDEGDANQGNPEFSGYFMKGFDSANKYAAAKFYALNTNTAGTNNSDYTVKGVASTGTANYVTPITVTYDDDTNAKNIKYIVPTANLELYTAQYSNVSTDDTNLFWYYTAPNTTSGSEAPAMIHAVYHPDGISGINPIVFDNTKDIVVDIALANIYGTTASTAASVVNTAESWTPITADVAAGNTFQWVDGTNAFTYSGKDSDLKFYYNNDVEAGDSSAKLVDYVKLDENVTNKAYLAFDFDLNVHLDSVQVTFAEDGTESALAVGKATFTDGATTASGSATWKGASGEKGGASVHTATVTSKEITQLTWAADNEA